MVFCDEALSCSSSCRLHVFTNNEKVLITTSSRINKGSLLPATRKARIECLFNIHFYFFRACRTFVHLTQCVILFVLRQHAADSWQRMWIFKFLLFWQIFSLKFDLSPASGFVFCCCSLWYIACNLKYFVDFKGFSNISFEIEIVCERKREEKSIRSQ